MNGVYCTYNITVLNSSGAAIVLTYGSVNESWLAHPKVVNTQGFIQVSGMGTAYGNFKIEVSGEIIHVDFSYTPGKNPTFTPLNINAGPYIAQVTNGPYVEGMSANCTFQVVDPRK